MKGMVSSNQIKKVKIMKTKKQVIAQIVVGLGYGDEGKGITTDLLCSQASNPIVIRFSGGQQAGHTVIHDGIKHVFANFGSGSLRGVPTYFSEHTVFYPTTIARELKVLNEKGINPRLILHPLAKMTTPYDVFSNREDSRNLGDGSCGLGINKTMRRNETPFKLYAIDLFHREKLAYKLHNIATQYYGLEKLTEAQHIEMEDYIDAITSIDWEIRNYDVLADFDELIFEGSQGIMLDMDHGVFPNVTHANTTSKNAHDILDKLHIHDRHIYYITRCYLTRHGAGPFPNEQEVKLINNEEETNVFNEYQKEFKTAPIDYDLLNYALVIDSIYSNSKVVTKNLMVTCLDQMPDFKFDYNKLNVSFSKIYESRSPVTENLLKKSEKSVAF